MSLRPTNAGGRDGSITFYFDLGSPYAYLACERLQSAPALTIHWQPLLLGGLFKLNGRSSWALGEHRRRQSGIAEVERRARGYGLPPMSWPEPWPGDYLFAMRVATFAFTRGKGREFTTCAFRAAFQRASQLSVAACVLDAAERAGLDRAEAQDGAETSQIKLALREATEAAHARGVIGVPTIAVDEELLWGEDRLEEAVSRARGAPALGLRAR